MRTYASFRRPATCAFTMIALFLTVLSAHAGPLTPVKLRVGGKEVALQTPAVCDGHEVYLPLDAFKAMGAGFHMTARDETVVIALPDGPAIEVALARPGPHVMVPLTGIMKSLDLAVVTRDRICSLRLSSGRIIQELPAAPKPPDIGPADSASEPQRLDTAVPGRQTPTTSKGNAAPTHQDSPKTTSDSQAVQKAASVDGGQPAQTPDTNPAVSAVTTPPVAPAKAALIRIDGIEFEPVSKTAARIHVKTQGRVSATTTILQDPPRLAIDIANSDLGAESQHTPVEHPFVAGIHAMAGERPGVTRVTLDLSRQVTYRLMPPDSNGFTLNLGIPGPTKQLSDLLIVIDPGHGGAESPNPVGASVVINGKCIMEKNLTLAIAQKVRAILEENGAEVIMTRTTDRSVPLRARPATAISNHADLFVSIHIDDCEHPNTASGTTAYYPGQDGASRNLAKSIVDKIGSVSGLPNRHARSDRDRFAGTGMAVLHCGGIPCTLVEVGYLNNARDRDKLVNPEFQETVARAVVDGIQDHLLSSGPEPVAGPMNPSHPMDRIGTR